MDATQMAQGGMQQGGMPQQPQVQAVPGQTQTGDPRKIMDALQAAIQQAVNSQGYVDLNKLILLWPQISKQFGINIPFQTVMQLIKQNPSILENLVVRYGLSGMVVNGQRITAEQMAGQMTAGGGMS